MKKDISDSSGSIGYPNLMCFGHDLSNCSLLNQCPDYQECNEQYKKNWLRLLESDIKEYLFTISLIGKHRMLFIKEPNMTLAKEIASTRLQQSIRDPAGKFDYVILYDSENKKEYRKNGIGSEWETIKG